MSSLFQGLTEPDGRVKVTTSATGAVPLRGLMVSPDGRVLIAEDTGQARVHHSGRAFDPATGALLVDPAAVTEVLGMGGMTVDINGGVITKGVAPDVIHQGVGLTNEGYLAIDRGAPEGSIFYAPLSSNLDEVVAGLTVNYSRSLEALYEPTPGQWAIAGDGVPRFESGYFLNEPSATNKNSNYNANPDAGLSNLTVGGDPSAVLSRVSDSALGASGLGAICTDGNAIELDNSAGSTDAYVDISGTTGNTNPHSFSAFARTVSGSGFVQSSTGTNQAPVVGTNLFERTSVVGADTAGAVLRIRVTAGSRCHFVLNGLVEEDILSTPIITRGASASRGTDLPNYPGINAIFNQTEGMASVDWIPKHAQSDTFSTIGLVTLQDTANLIYYNRGNDRISTTDGVGGSSVIVNPFSSGEVFRAVSIYGPPGTGPDIFSAGYYRDGSWAWDTNNARTYTGPFPASSNALRLNWLVSSPTLIRNVTLWDVNQGRAWVEANLTP